MKKIKTNQYISAKHIYPENLLEHAHFYRGLAMKIDRDPSIINHYKNHPAMTLFLDDMTSTCLERTKRFECLSYGDVGVLLAAPGPSLSGQMIRELGNTKQKEFFFDYVNTHRAKTFLAVTEPDRGSDAAHLETALIPTPSKQTFYLGGEKCFVGNGAVGDIGIVIARLSPGPLGMMAVLITPEQRGTPHCPDPTLIRRNIPTIGLRGSSLSHLQFMHYEVYREQILGEHLRIVQRGLMGLMKTFNRMRTCVGALAVGLSQAVLDYVYEIDLGKHEQALLIAMAAELNIARKMLYHAAELIDEDVTNSAAASMAKVIATQTAERIVADVMDFFDANVFYEHPLLEKWHRDVYGFEFMEGTRQIHYKNVANQHMATHYAAIING